MPMLEGNVDAVIGVDTHRDSHAAAILNPNGGLLAQLEVPSSQAGYQQLLAVACQHAASRRCRALEGTGCYGAGLTSFLLAHGEWVIEIDRPKRGSRSAAKSDALDAIRAGREALARDQLTCPRQRGHREALRVLHLARSGAVKVAEDARRHLKALLVTAPEPLRAQLRCRCLAAASPDMRGAAGSRQRPGGGSSHGPGTARDRPADPPSTPGGQRTGAGAPHAGQGRDAGAAGPAWDRAGHRRAAADQLVAPGPAAL